jgi:hypothetical protein
MARNDAAVLLIVAILLPELMLAAILPGSKPKSQTRQFYPCLTLPGTAHRDRPQRTEWPPAAPH